MNVEVLKITAETYLILGEDLGLKGDSNLYYYVMGLDGSFRFIRSFPNWEEFNKFTNSSDDTMYEIVVRNLDVDKLLTSVKT